MFYTVASILITVVTLLFGVGYIVYKNIIQMITNLDEKYECRLQIKLSEINTKFNETITVLESRIKSLENTTDHNLEHTETLMIDLNNKNNITRNMLYDVKTEFARTTSEYTTHYTNTTNDIKVLKDNYVTQNNDIKLLKDNFVTQEELNEAIHNIKEYEIPKGPIFIKCENCTNTSLCFECNTNMKYSLEQKLIRLTKDYKHIPIFKNAHRVLIEEGGKFNGKVMLVRINKKYYYNLKGTHFETKKDKEFLIDFKGTTKLFDLKIKGIEHLNEIKYCHLFNYPSDLTYYSIGEIDVITKEVTFY